MKTFPHFENKFYKKQGFMKSNFSIEYLAVMSFPYVSIWNSYLYSEKYFLKLLMFMDLR